MFSYCTEAVSSKRHHIEIQIDHLPDGITPIREYSVPIIRTLFLHQHSVHHKQESMIQPFDLEGNRITRIYTQNTMCIALIESPRMRSWQQTERAQSIILCPRLNTTNGHDSSSLRLLLMDRERERMCKDMGIESGWTLPDGIQLTYW